MDALGNWERVKSIAVQCRGIYHSAITTKANIPTPLVYAKCLEGMFLLSVGGERERERPLGSVGGKHH